MSRHVYEEPVPFEPFCPHFVPEWSPKRIPAQVGVAPDGMVNEVVPSGITMVVAAPGTTFGTTVPEAS